MSVPTQAVRDGAVPLALGQLGGSLRRNCDVRAVALHQGAAGRVLALAGRGHTRMDRPGGPGTTLSMPLSSASWNARMNVICAPSIETGSPRIATAWLI